MQEKENTGAFYGSSYICNPREEFLPKVQRIKMN